MLLNHQPHRLTWQEIAAFAGNFLLIPLWDAYALFAALRAAWRALPTDRRNILNLILSAPVRRLIMLAAAYGLAWTGFGLFSGGIIQPGPFGVLVTGLAHLPERAAQPCCDTSMVMNPGEPVAGLIAAALPLTLKLLAASIVLSGVIILLLLGVERGLEHLTARREQAGRAAGLLWWLATSALAAPVGAAALLVVLILGVRLGLLPATAGESGRGLMAAALVVAMLPALLAARASQRGRANTSLPGMAAGEAFFSQAGWLLSSIIAAEVVFGLDGTGALLVEAVNRGDAAVVVGVMRVLAPILLVLHARAAINRSMREVLLPEPAVEATAPATATSKRGWLRPALGITLILLPLAAALLWLPQQRQPADPGAVYARASDSHPLGTDGAGRDVRGALSEGILEASAIAGLGGLVALSFSSWWGELARQLAHGNKAGRAWLAGIILLPAQAAVLIHPVGVALLLKAATSAQTASASTSPVLWFGIATGLMLVPRLALAIGAADVGETRANASRGFLIAALGCAIFGAFLYSQLVGLAWAGLPGILIAAPRELIAGAQIVPGGPYLRLSVMLAAPGVLMSAGLYLLAGALLGRLPPRQADLLVRLLG